jgi:hypothetical protein
MTPETVKSSGFLFVPAAFAGFRRSGRHRNLREINEAALDMSHGHMAGLPSPGAGRRRHDAAPMRGLAACAIIHQLRRTDASAALAQAPDAWKDLQT